MRSFWKSNYVQTRVFPRNIQSLISNLEVKINGSSIQIITRYIFIDNALNNYMCGTDAAKKNRIGENAGPSYKSAWVHGIDSPRRGYPIGLCNSNVLTSDDKFDSSSRDVDNYTICNWLIVLLLELVLNYIIRTIKILLVEVQLINQEILDLVSLQHH
jgi:hypothetical protein